MYFKKKMFGFILIFFTFFVSNGCLNRNPSAIKGIIPNILETSSSSSSGTSTESTTVDTCASASPSNPAGLTITTVSSPAKVSITWTNPDSCKWKGVLVKRKTGSSPVDTNDGTTISVNSDNLSLDDTSVVNSTLYYYKIFSYNSKDVYSSGMGVAALVGKTTIAPSSISDNSITIDGQDSESAWLGVPKISFSFPVVPTFSDYTGGSDLNVTGYIKFAYDKNYFYVYYHSDDKFFRVDSTGNPWVNDGIEMFFDMGFNRTTTPDTNDFHIIVTPLSGANYESFGKGNGTTWVAWTPTITRSNYTTGSTLNTDGDIDSGYNIEMRIPFTDLGISQIVAGQIIGFTFWVNDDDLVAFTNAQHWFRWTTGTLSTNPSTWGIVQF